VKFGQVGASPSDNATAWMAPNPPIPAGQFDRHAARPRAADGAPILHPNNPLYYPRPGSVLIRKTATVAHQPAGLDD
jgi:hypothetical protein